MSGIDFLKPHIDKLESEPWCVSAAAIESHTVRVKFKFQPEGCKDEIILSCVLIVPDNFPNQCIQDFTFDEPIPYHANVTNADLPEDEAVRPYGSFGHKFEHKTYFLEAYREREGKITLGFFIEHFMSVWSKLDESSPIPSMKRMYDDNMKKYFALQRKWYKSVVYEQKKKIMSDDDDSEDENSDTESFDFGSDDDDEEEDEINDLKRKNRKLKMKERRTRELCAETQMELEEMELKLKEKEEIIEGFKAKVSSLEQKLSVAVDEKANLEKKMREMNRK